MSNGYDPRVGRAAGIVTDAAEDLEQPLSERCEKQARRIAKHTELHSQINRAPSAVAAGAVYIAAMLACEQQNQKDIAEACGVTAVTVRNSYNEILGLESGLVRQQVVGRIAAARSGRVLGAWRESQSPDKAKRSDTSTALIGKLLSWGGGYE